MFRWQISIGANPGFGDTPHLDADCSCFCERDMEAGKSHRTWFICLRVSRAIV